MQRGSQDFLRGGIRGACVELMAKLMSIEDYIISGTQFALTLATLVLLCLAPSKQLASGETRNSCIFNRMVRILSVSLGAAYLGAGIVAVAGGRSGRDDTTASARWLQISVSSFVRGLAWLTLGSTVRLHRGKPFYFGRTVQVWYIITFVAGMFEAIMVVFDLVYSGAEVSMEMALALASWPVASLLLYCAAADFNKAAASRIASGKEQLSEPLLQENWQQSVYNKGSNSKDEGLIGSPFTEAGFFSRLTFAWLNPLLSAGRKGTLETADMPPLRRDDKAAENYELFLRALERQESSARQECRKSTSILWILGSCYWRKFCLTGFFAFLKSVTVSIGPIAVNLFIDYAAGNRAFKYEGVVLVTGLLSAKLIEVVSQRHWNFGDRRIGIQIRSALSAAIYEKEMRLSTAGRQRHTAGDITNYIAVDAFKVGEFPYWLHMLWATPLQVMLISSILFVSIGRWGTFIGLGVIVLTALVSGKLAETQQKRIADFTKAQDVRMRAIIEVLRSIKILKLQAWEERFLEKVDNARTVEMKALKLCWESKNHTISIFWAAPVIVPVVTFLACVLFGTPLDSRSIFTAFACIRIIQQPISCIPDVIAAMIQMRVSLARIEDFLGEEEVHVDAVLRDPREMGSGIAIEIVHGVFSWESTCPTPTLKEISLEVRHGETVAVCGQVGSGKTTLLCAILGEIDKRSGVVRVAGSVAYVAQSAWIQSGTVRDNILFGKRMNDGLYKQVLDACALSQDLENFAFGDVTEIGERGLNLSGGQRQRLQLARAIYQDADIYLLDDPFSAVDAHTSSSLYKNCILGLLAKKTVILVTHQVEFLHTVDHIALLEQGKICERGKFEDLARSGRLFQRLVKAHKDLNSSDPNQQMARNGKENNAELELKRSGSRSNWQEDNSGVGQSGQLTKDEDKESTSTNLQGYISYWKTANSWCWLWVSLLLYVIYLALNLGATWWLATQIDIPGVDIARLVVTYSALVVFSTFLIHLRGIACNHVTWAASLAHFQNLKNSIFHAPMAFFDTTPAGRVLTRFSTDMHLLDFEVPHTGIYTIFAFIYFATIAFMTGLGAWQIMLIALPMFACSFKLLQRYLATANQLMRIYGTTRSPLLNHSGETIAGIVSIRAFEVEDQFMKKGLQLIDVNASPYFHSVAANEWLALRIEALSGLLLFASTIFLSTFPISPGFVGLALSYGLAINSSLFVYVNIHCRAANNLISVERIRQYMNIPSEAPLIIERSRPTPHWPTKGKVELKNLKLRYRPDAPLVLRGITCQIEGGQKVGIVGRTGSGKSTLISVLFRLVEPSEGQVLIDDLDISTIGLHDLRSKLSIISQEPTLFKGPIRFNLDPFCQHSDPTIWEALQKCRLQDDIQMKGGLDAAVGEDGDNWSLGQRQLFCLARALLKKSQILVLDEATASIDNATDALLQQTIREQFTSCTVITVAHRIPTVINGDMVMALSDGVMVEYGRPAELLKSRSSLFAKLVAEYWAHSQHS